MVWPDENTRPGVRQLHVVSEPLDADERVLVGQLMTETVKLQGTVRALTAAQTTLSSEVSGLRRDIELDRKELVRVTAAEAAKASATHTSNRLAVLIGTLWALYEQAAPYLHELWKAVHK